MKRMLFVAAIVAATSSAASAQYIPPGGWSSSTFGNQTFHYGTGGNQGWSGSTLGFGNQSFSSFNGPRGQVRQCSTMRFGAQVYTNCN